MLDENVLHVVAGARQVLVGVAVPVALHGKDVVRAAQERVAHDGVAAAQPVHAVLVGVGGIAADHAQIVEHKSRGVLHLDGPGPRPHDAGQPVDLDVLGLQRANAVPVGLLHPAFVAVGVLGSVIDDGSAAKNFYILNFP